METNKKTAKLLASFQSSSNPYTFASSRIIPQKQQTNQGLSASERAIVREQHATLFEHDEAMQKLFKGNFDEYFSAIENPDLMIQRMDERVREIEHELTGAQNSIIDEHEDDLLNELDDMEAGSDEQVSEIEIQELDFAFEQDALYKKVCKWSDKLHELGHIIYDEQGFKDSDIFRVTINAFLVASKIAYAVDMDEDSFDLEDEHIIKIELETSIRAFSLAMTFLQRIRESLVILINKKVHPTNQWRASLAASDEIVLEIQKRVLGLKQKLDPKSK